MRIFKFFSKIDNFKNRSNISFFIFYLLFVFLLFAPVQTLDATSQPPQVYYDELEDSSFYLTKLPQASSNTVKWSILIPLYIILFILAIYVIRHYLLAFNRLFGEQYNPYAEILEGNWPTVTIMVPAHNEETVINDILIALLKVDYPKELMQVIIVNDRSTDGTSDIVNQYVSEYPNFFLHFDRKTGTPGKSAALFDAMPLVKHEITLVFDADYIPGTFLIKQLVAPFFDPEVGSVMGRVVPGNTEKNILTRLIDIERTGGYQVNQQARENWQATPQYGGTCGGLRTQALDSVGGWDGSILAEDTEITFRLLTHDWITVYQNNAECIELVPETWSVRIRQIKR